MFELAQIESAIPIFGMCLVMMFEVEGRKDDCKKLRWELLPMDCIEDVVRVLSHGARKYNDNDWMQVDNPVERYYAASMRHLSRWRQGYKNDKETGRSHLTHAICCLIFLWWFDKNNK